jgi:hypothetical protein
LIGFCRFGSSTASEQEYVSKGNQSINDSQKLIDQAATIAAAINSKYPSAGLQLIWRHPELASSDQVNELEIQNAKYQYDDLWKKAKALETQTSEWNDELTGLQQKRQAGRSEFNFYSLCFAAAGMFFFIILFITAQQKICGTRVP